MHFDVENNDLFAWPLVEAKKVFEHFNKTKGDQSVCKFETGYAPSGIPHLGTFCEVKRILYVMQACNKIFNMKTELICFSDDLDPLRSVPNDIPNKEHIGQYLDYPLSSIPDPFGKYESFAEYMNEKMRQFLNAFEIKHTFFSSKKCYESGMFDEYLIKMLAKYNEVMDVMLPTLRYQRQSTYSPFFPICPITGKILQVPIQELCLKTNTIAYIHPTTEELTTTQVTGGKCKLQWKPDFAMRWAALDIKYELFGKDHLINKNIYNQICTILGKEPPITFGYELFLNAEGKKLSKSKGNSINIETLLEYFPRTTIELFLYQNPQKAKKISFDIMIQTTDLYISMLQEYHDFEQEKQINNPLYHIHNSDVPKINLQGINFSILINLISITQNDGKATLKNLISQYSASIINGLDGNEYFEELLTKAIKYHKDFIKKTQKYLTPSKIEKEILYKICEYIKDMIKLDTTEIQNYIYSLAREFKYDNTKKYFQTLYQILLGQENGPRLGTLVCILGKQEFTKLVDQKCKN